MNSGAAAPGPPIGALTRTGGPTLDAASTRPSARSQTPDFPEAPPARLSGTHARISDEGDAPPRRYRASRAVDIRLPGDAEWSRVNEYVFEPQTVGDLASDIVGAFLSGAGSDYRLGVGPDREWRRRHWKDFQTYWAERKGRENCRGWLRLALDRAYLGSKPLRGAAIARVAQFRLRLDELDRPYRNWLLLDLRFTLLVGDELVDDETLIRAVRGIGAPALMDFLFGRSPDVSDPDFRLGPHTAVPYVRMVDFILRHAVDILPDAPVDALLQLERRHLAGESVGDAPRCAIPAWSIAAADLQPDRARTILRSAMQRFVDVFNVDCLDARALLALALWRHAGADELDYLVNWFYTDSPRANSSGSGRHRFAAACINEENWPLLRALLADDRISEADAGTVKRLIFAVNALAGREVANLGGVEATGCTPELLLRLRSAVG